MITLRVTEAQAAFLARRAGAEGYAEDAGLRPFVLASIILGIGNTPIGEYRDNLLRLRDHPLQL